MRIGLPKEERLRQKISDVLGRINEVQELSRNTWVDLLTIRTGDMYTDCITRFLDVALTSTEVLVESAIQYGKQRLAQGSNRDKLLAVAFPMKPWHVCSYTWKERNFNPRFHTIDPGTSIASEFPLITRARYYFPEIYGYEGCVEQRVMHASLARPQNGQHAYGVGIVDSGKTLEEYKLKVIDKIIEVRPMWLFGAELLDDKETRRKIEGLILLSGSSLSDATEIERYNPTLGQFFL